MRTFGWLVLISTIALVAGCRSQQQAAAPGPVPVGTIREVMHGIVEHNAFVLFNSVAVTVTAEGTTEKQPRTDEDWDILARAALTLAEAPNLLVTPGRHIAKPEEENTSDGPTELTPVQIQARIDANRELWLKHVGNLQAVGLEAFKITAVDKSVEALFGVGEKIDQVCENCHLEFWYPAEREQPAP